MLFCFGGEPKRGQVNAGRFTNHRRSFFDLDWNDLGISLKPPPNENNIPRLQNSDGMIDGSRSPDTALRQRRTMSFRRLARAVSSSEAAKPLFRVRP